MRVITAFNRLLPVLLVGTVAACEDATIDAEPPAGADAGLDGLEAGTDGGMVPIDASDAALPLSDVVLADAGMFDCQGCACNGATQFCLFYDHHFRDVPVPDSGTCQEVENGTGCHALPASCEGAPTCACLASYGCECTDVGGGLEVHCWLG